ncbi:MAG TPA: DUF6152 family protein [Gammaproteobacteria bacterium]
MRAVSIAILSVFVAVPAAAHHSALMFDRDSVVAFQGTVTRFDWTNPHVYIIVETEDATGETVEWELETDATPILTRSGWSERSLNPGDLVAVRANPEHNTDRHHALLVSVTRADGSVLAARSNFLRREDAAGEIATSLEGTWELGFQDYLDFVPAWMAVPPTAEGAAAQAAYDVKFDSPEAQCIALPSPGILAAPYLNQIEVLDDRVLIHNERFAVEREIFMDGRSFPDDGARSNQGYSIGRWDGDALVVETRLFEEHRSQFLGSGLPSGPNKRVVERYSLGEGGTYLSVDFTLEDLDILTEPFTGTLNWYYAPHFDYLGFDCDADVSRRYLEN